MKYVFTLFEIMYSEQEFEWSGRYQTWRKAKSVKLNLTFSTLEKKKGLFHLRNFHGYEWLVSRHFLCR